MKPLFHPSIEDVTVEGILHALSDPVRASIFLDIAGTTSSLTCSNFPSAREQNVPKSTLSQHFKVLRDAGLIRGERHGVEMKNVSRCAEIEKRFPGLIPSIIRAKTIQKQGKSHGGAGAKTKSASTRR
ncbi:MAG TPA: helix-turn-helix domain-containing protein [Opitutaceae bacterium]|nr:helix-turn-helix domain-containing protein [Opitutaceae bacterium]